VLDADHLRAALRGDRGMRRAMADIFAQLFLVAVLCGVVTSRGLFDYDDERKQM